MAVTEMGIESVHETELADLAGLDVERLEAQIRAWAGRRAADECAWLLLIGEFDRREGYASWECQSTAYWLSWHCGLSMGAGRERVRVARALEHLPRVRAEFAAGRLTYSKVRAITRVGTADTEELLVELGVAGTAAQLERICAAYRRVDRGDQPDGETMTELAVWHDDQGRWRLRAALAEEDGALLDAALAVALERLTDGAATSSVPAETPEPTRADALIELARAYLSTHAPTPTIERRHLLMVLDVGSLTVDGSLAVDHGGRCTLNGRRLTPQTALRIGLDADVTHLLVDHRGLPLSVGRRSRDATLAQQLALLIRDGGCRWPGCPNQRTHAHHIIEWDNGGLTDLINLLLFCRYHHRRVHKGGYLVSLDPDTAVVEIRRPDGSPVVTSAVDPADLLARPEVGDEPLPPGEAGVRLELDDIVEGLCWRRDRGRARGDDTEEAA